jgi:hypothetical protein
MHSLPKLSTQLFELCSLLLAYRLSKHRKLSLPGFSANMGETQKVERLWLSLPTL